MPKTFLLRLWKIYAGKSSVFAPAASFCFANRSKTAGATPDFADQVSKTDEPGASLRQNIFMFDFAWSGEAEHESIQRRRKAKDESTLAKTDEPGEAKDESTLAKTGHVQVPPRYSGVGLH